LGEGHGVDVPLLLMNSFNTDEDTAAVLHKYAGCATTIKSFNQSKFPRMYRDTMQPAPKTYGDKEGWYPPGHGDLYRSLADSGMLDQLIAEGKEYLFVSNIDNLGSVVDFKILKQFADDEGCEFIMEVTNKTRADVKGGTLIEYEGRCRLLEIAQVAKENVAEFKNVSKFKIFNTNNLWIKLSAIKRLLSEGAMHMEIIENKKVMGGLPVIQFEQAVGSAIKNFRGSIGVNVPRSRFLPVKQCQDLLLVMSDLFNLNHGMLTRNPDRVEAALPLVKLGNEFKNVSDFLSRFESIPEMVELDHLTISGDVHFGSGVTLKGTVIIIATEGQRIEIPPRALLENKIVTGDLRLLDH
jgi:UTP--glucose-1-phosphate uridylyltransferase